jgi:hypothetical protein
MSMRPVYPYKRTDPVVCSRFDLRVEGRHSATLIRCGNADYANRTCKDWNALKWLGLNRHGQLATLWLGSQD